MSSEVLNTYHIVVGTPLLMARPPPVPIEEESCHAIVAKKASLILIGADV